MIFPCLLPSLQKGSLRSYCMNEEVLRLGLARTAPVAGVLPDSRLYWRLHRRLHRAEVKAERKGRGMWKEDTLWERTSKAIRDNTVIRLMKRIFKRTWCTKWAMISKSESQNLCWKCGSGSQKCDILHSLYCALRISLSLWSALFSLILKTYFQEVHLCIKSLVHLLQMIETCFTVFLSHKTLKMIKKVVESSSSLSFHYQLN